MDHDRESPAQFLGRTRWLWAALVAAYAVVGANLPPMDDEVYYWTWSTSPQLSYYDHPGMTAWLIWLSTRLFGDTILGIRFPAACCVTMTLCVIAYLTSSRLRFGGEGTRRFGLHPLLLGIALTPLFTFGGILITPDAPLIACWTLYLLWLVQIHEALGWHAPESLKGVVLDGMPRPSQSLRDVPPGSFWTWWLIGGILLGLGGLSKYTMILAVPSGFASFLISGIPWRRWFWGYVAQGVMAILVASPILLYNVQHNFEPLLFQWRHAMHDEPATLVTFAEFFGVQLLLFGTLPFYLAPWTLRHLFSLRLAPRLRVCSCLYLLPLIFFIYKAAKTELEGNWGLVAFLSVWPVAAAWFDTIRDSRLWRWLTAASFLPPLIAVLGLTVLLLSPVSLLPPEIDRLSKQRARWEMSRQLADFIRARGEAIPVFSTTYQLTALLRFHGLDARQEGTSRPSHYTFPPESVTDFSTAYFVDEIADGQRSRSLLRTETLLATFPTVVRGAVVQEYGLWKSEKRAEISNGSSR